MAHFYGSVQGQAGEATRMGSRGSGIRGWVQSWGVRLHVSMDHNERDDRDEAWLSIGQGPQGNGGSLTMVMHDADTFAKALASGDKRVAREVKRIEEAFAKLNEIAADAVERAEKERERQRRRQDRERKADERRRIELIGSLTDEEIRNLWAAGRMDGHPDAVIREDKMLRLKLAFPQMERDDKGRVIVNAKPRGAWQTYSFDATSGQWVLPFEPNDLGIAEAIKDTGFGWRIEENPINV